ncbi:MAG: hypothetical protein IJS52_08800 [Bacilli bacterium]|nr:hypothetical protein [Bacilli bacterium]
MRKARSIIIHAGWALPLLLVGATVYQALSGGYWFLLISALFVLETIIGFLFLFRGKPFKVAAMFQFILSPFAMAALLFSTTLNGGSPHALSTIIATAIYGALQVGLLLFWIRDYRVSLDVRSYALIYRSLISLLYGLNLLSAMVLKNAVTEQNVVVLLLTFIGINALSTGFVAYFAIAALVTAYASKALPFKEKVLSVSRFFVKHHIGFLFGEAFCLFSLVISFWNIRKSELFFFLGIFYSLLFAARLIGFIWNKRLETSGVEKKVLSRKKHGILLFNSIFFLSFGNVLGVSSLLLSASRASADVPVWFFVGFMFPFSVLSFVMALVHKRSSKRVDDAYLEVMADQSMITSLFSFFAGVTYFVRFIPNEQVSARVWIMLWLVVMVSVTANLTVSFVRAIQGLRGRRKMQQADAEEKQDVPSAE